MKSGENAAKEPSPLPMAPQAALNKKTQRHWTRERILAAADQFVERYNRYPQYKELNETFGLPSANTITAYFCMTIQDFFEQRYPNLKAESGKKWALAPVLEEFQQFAQKHNRLPTVNEMRQSPNFPNLGTLLRLSDVKRYTEFATKYFPQVPPRHTKWNKENCIQAVERFYKAHGRPPRVCECNQTNDLPTRNTFKSHVGQSIQTYFYEAYSYVIQPPQQRWDRDMCEQAVYTFVEKNHRIPNSREFNKENGLPHLDTFRRHMHTNPYCYCKEKFPQYAQPKWDCAQIESAVQQFVYAHGRAPKLAEMRGCNNLPDSRTVEKVTGMPAAQYLKEKNNELSLGFTTNPEVGITMKGF